MMIKTILVVLFGTLLLACGSEPDPADKPQNASGIIPDHQLKALEDAKNVERMMSDADAKRRKTLEKMEN